jgi:uncharacterized protein (TIGR02147 family)
MKVFEFNSYKKYLNNYIERSGRRGLISELARAAGCTHSYLSQVLNGKPDLTPDQAWSLTEHLLLSTEEAEYFFTLVLNERAATPKLKKNLEAKLKALKSEQTQTTKVVSKTTDAQLLISQRDRYYSQWTVGAIHSLTASKEYQTIEKLSDRLNLSKLEVEQNLQWLVENSLVKKSGNRFLHSGQNIHLPTEAIHNQINHLNWRLRAVQASFRSDEIHYTSTFTISQKDWDYLRRELLTFIESQRKQIQSSGSDEGFVFCCDLFKM